MTQRFAPWTARLIMTASVLLFSACSSGVDIDLAEHAADEFHLRVGKGQVDAIYNDAADEYHMSISRELNRSRFARLQRKMGTCTNSVATAIAVNTGPWGTTVTASYQTTCSAGALDESFRWAIVDGKARIEAYDARSPLLLTD